MNAAVRRDGDFSSSTVVVKRFTPPEITGVRFHSMPTAFALRFLSGFVMVCP
jgi:hypothetical protein